MWKIRFKMIHDVKTSVVQSFNILISGVSSRHDSIQINNCKQFLFSILIPPLCLQSSFYLLNLSLTYVLCFCVYYYLYYNSRHYLLLQSRLSCIEWVYPEYKSHLCTCLNSLELQIAPRPMALVDASYMKAFYFWFAPHLLPHVSLKWHPN